MFSGLKEAFLQYETLIRKQIAVKGQRRRLGVTHTQHLLLYVCSASLSRESIDERRPWLFNNRSSRNLSLILYDRWSLLPDPRRVALDVFAWKPPAFSYDLCWFGVIDDFFRALDKLTNYVRSFLEIKPGSQKQNVKRWYMDSIIVSHLYLYTICLFDTQLFVCIWTNGYFTVVFLNIFCSC